jgi:hypothetical protein
MQLPGGLIRAGERVRQVRLRDPDGELTLRIAEIGREALDLHEGVSRVLALAVELGGEAISTQTAGELCVADRQFLMQRLACRLGLGQSWRSIECAGCHQRFDFSVDLEALPVREAGAGFPYATVETSAGRVRVRVATGADQIAAAASGDGERELLRRCLVDGPVALTPADVTRIEEALEAVSPSVTVAVAAACPECDRTAAVSIDPYVALDLPVSSLLDQVHSLAWHYHWSEREILALPRHRREYYLSCVDRARGLST